MRVLYGVQGTGHGHISRAKVVIPLLREVADVDVLISGYNFNLDLGGKIAYKKRGVSFAYDNKGAIDLFDTAMSLKPVRFLQDVQSIPVKEYDLVINDFEPVSAWAAQSAKIPCIGLSHQASFVSELSPRPKKKSLMAEGIMKHFAPCDIPIGTHYLKYDDFIVPPILRAEIKKLDPIHGEHITVYLPAFDYETLITFFSEIPEVRWEVFSPTCDAFLRKTMSMYILLEVKLFLKSFESSLGLVCSAGFEAPSEAMYLGKKLLVIPIKNQYEQVCNAVALEEMGVGVIYSIKPDFISKLKNWVREAEIVHLPEICNEAKLIEKIVEVVEYELFVE